MGLLINEPPLQVLPSLAVKIGLNEAIVLQQLHYWLIRSRNVKEGYKWVYNSYADWNKQFPFWGKNTLIRAFKSLEKQGILISSNFNKANFDKTKWYRIDYQKLEGLGKSSTQNGYTSNPDWVDGATQNGYTYTKRLPENTTETTTNNKQLPPKGVSQAQPDVSFASQVEEIIDYLNQKTSKHYKAKTEKTRRLIHARMKEGFSVADFKKVIDNKLHDDWFVKKGFMRPETLFGTKFEGYLNETPKKTFKEAQEERYSKDFWGNEQPTTSTSTFSQDDGDVPF